jgi:hypothetical protein
MAMLRHWTPSTVSRAFIPASVEAVPLKATARRGRGALDLLAARPMVHVR